MGKSPAREVVIDVNGALAVTDAYLATFNAGDVRGHAETLAYPHLRLAGGEIRTWDTIDAALPPLERAIEEMRSSGWHHSRWDHRSVIHASGDKVHLDVQFSRRRADDSTIAAYASLYVVVRLGSAWLIQCRSSFAP